MLGVNGPLPLIVLRVRARRRQHRRSRLLLLQKQLLCIRRNLQFLISGRCCNLLLTEMRWHWHLTRDRHRLVFEQQSRVGNLHMLVLRVGSQARAHQVFVHVGYLRVLCQSRGRRNAIDLLI